MMKTVKEKDCGADFAGYPLKEAVCKHLRDRVDNHRPWRNRSLG